jgi:3-oxoacyl-[acyl-carrier protein] reductase
MQAAHSAAKGGLIGLTKAVAKEMAQQGILVNCVTSARDPSPLTEAPDPPAPAPLAGL